MQAGNTPLHAACSCGSKACVEHLLHAKATIDKKNRVSDPRLSPSVALPPNVCSTTEPDLVSADAGSLMGCAALHPQAGLTPLDVARGSELLAFLENRMRSTPGISISSVMRFLASLVSRALHSAYLFSSARIFV